MGLANLVLLMLKHCIRIGNFSVDDELTYSLPPEVVKPLPHVLQNHLNCGAGLWQTLRSMCYYSVSFTILSM